MRINSNSLTSWAPFSLGRLLISVLTSIIVHHKSAEWTPITPHRAPSLQFDLLSRQEVHDLIRASKKKTCSLDPIPTKPVFECLDILLPVITKIINYSLEHGIFPSAWKNALVIPLLKRDGLEPIFKNYRPGSNLQFISKLAESAVAKQRQHHITRTTYFPCYNHHVVSLKCT